MNIKEKLQYTLAFIIALVAIVIACVALWMPPQGEISESVLWFFAQSLLFVASIFGVSAMANKDSVRYGTEKKD